MKFLLLYAVLLLLFQVQGSSLKDVNYEQIAANLPIDTAAVSFMNLVNSSSLEVYYRESVCYHCLYQSLFVVPPQQSLWANLTTKFPVEFQIFISNQNYSLLNFSESFGEHGVYTIVLQKNNLTYAEQMSIEYKPRNAFIPILVAFGIYVGLAVIFFVGNLVYKKLLERRIARVIVEDRLEGNALIQHEKNEQNGSIKPKKGGRVISLDAFRGICLVVMIFANYGGGKYWFFNHSYWNGLTVADLVFPWFIFIMGVAIPISFSSLVKRKTSGWSMFYKIVRRSVILFGLGLLVNNGFNYPHFRIPGVLQRFGISYLFTSLIVSFVPALKSSQKVRKEEYEALVENKVNVLDDILPFIVQWGVALGFPILWLALTFGLEVPGCGKGYLGPGGIGDFGKHWNCTGGAARYIDLKVFGINHIYGGPTCSSVYQCPAYDPEGLLGCLTSIFLCWLGVQTGRIILTHKQASSRIIRFAVWGVALGVLGLVLCKGEQNGGWIPINKNLWSLSFVLVMGATGNIFLLICYCLIDVFKIWSGVPFVFPGMNSILIYFGSELLSGVFPFSFIILNSQHPIELTKTLTGVTCWVLVAYYAYICDFFVNV